MLHYKAFNYKESISLFDFAYADANRKKNFGIASNCLNELGTIEQNLNNPEESLFYFRKALQGREG